jgi:uncharacterized protein
MKSSLLDTGPLVAYLDARDPSHEACAAILSKFKGQLVTTSAVITEAMHFLGHYANGPTLLLEFVTDTSLSISDYCQPEKFRRAVGLISKYADTPMDFADATLVLLAEDLDQRTIFTLDRRGFSTFRTAAGKRFEIVGAAGVG